MVRSQFVEKAQQGRPCFIVILHFFQSTGGSLSPLRLLYGVLCLGGFQLAVSHTAPTGELLTAPFLKGKEQPSQRLNEYGVGVDCHSGFFQICVLIPNDRELKKGSSPKRVGRKTRLTASKPRIFKGFLAFPPSD
jgi:hypothetical protein